MRENKAGQEPETGVLIDTAKAIGSTIGKLAAKTGLAEPAPAASPAASQDASPKPGKLQKKNRTRLPRLQKKAMKKARDTRGEADLERLVS